MRFWKRNFYKKYIKYKSNCTSQPLLILWLHVREMSNLSSWQLLHLMTNLVSVSFLKLLTKIISRKPTSSFMLRSFSDETKIQNLYSFSRTVACCIPVKKVNVKISWRKINYTALPFRLLSVEADVSKTCLFLFEIVFLLYEIQKKNRIITNIAVPKIIVTLRSIIIHFEICCRSSDVSGPVDTLPTVSFMSTDDGFDFMSSSSWEKINGSYFGGLTLLWQTNSAFSYLDLGRSRTQYGMRSLNTSLIETTK